VSGVLTIVNADDLGMSEQVNDAIFDLMSEKRISSATLLANAPALQHAVARVKHFPDCSFGVHLNLTQFEPVKGGPSARLIVDESGQLSRANETASPSLGRLKAIHEEMCAQIELLVSLGVSISHFDSHHHVHTRPHIFPALKAVQKRYGIRKVRISKNVYSPEQSLSKTMFLKKRAYNWALRNFYRTRTTEAFTELLTFWQVRRHRTLGYSSIELMVHPGASYAADEMSVLKSDWREDHEIPVEMINYNQLIS
jgi:predicted glycoside hydrolase/deacetylase ChbG (UPF0249 family)